MNPEKQTKIEHLVSPKHLPEAGFQSYEQLTSDAVEQRESFIAGEVRNPAFNYPKFHDLSKLDQGIIALDVATEEASQSIDNPDLREAMRSSLAFRAAEMEYVKLLARLDFLCKNDGSEEDIHEITEMAREMNHELYGRPNPEIHNTDLLPCTATVRAGLCYEFYFWSNPTICCVRDVPWRRKNSRKELFGVPRAWNNTATTRDYR